MILLLLLSSHIKVLTLFDRLVPTSFLLERDHFLDVWLLIVLNLIQAFSDLILLVLSLEDQVVKNVDRHVRLWRSIALGLSLL